MTRASRIFSRFVAAAVVCAAITTPCRSSTSRDGFGGLEEGHGVAIALVTSTPQLCRGSYPDWPSKGGDPFYQACDDPEIGGFVADAVSGPLDDGRTAIVLPLPAGGSIGVAYFLLYVSAGRSTHFIGAIPASSARVRFAGGHLQFVSGHSIFKPSARVAFVSQVDSYDVCGIRLRHLATYRYARRWPPRTRDGFTAGAVAAPRPFASLSPLEQDLQLDESVRRDLSP